MDVSAQGNAGRLREIRFPTREGSVMWWLDQTLYRQNRGNPGLYQPSFAHVAPRPAVTRNMRILPPVALAPLSNCQVAANLALLEVVGPNDGEANALRADLASLEQTIRSQKLAFQTRATEQQELASNAQASLRESEAENARLRNAIARVDQKLADRDSDSDDLQSRLAIAEQEFVEKMSQVNHHHQAECEHLRSVAALADSRAAARNAVIAAHEKRIAELESRIPELESQTQAKIVHVRELEQTRRDELETALFESDEKRQRDAVETQTLTEQLNELKSEYAELTTSSKLSADDRVAAQEAFDQRERLHSRSVAKLSGDLENKKSIVGGLRRQLDDQSQSNLDLDRQLHDASHQLLRTEDRILAIEETATTRLAAQQHGFDQWKAESQWEKNNLASELQLLGESLERQRNETQVHKTHAAGLSRQLGDLKVKVGAPNDVSSEDIKKLKTSLERQQDSALEQEKRAKETEQQLRMQCDGLQIKLNSMNEEVQSQTSEKQIQIGKLQGLLERRETEIVKLGDHVEQKQSDVRLKVEKIRELADQRERMVEIQNAQAESLKNRTDGLLFELDEEKEKRRIAENECRRLSLQRSERIAFLSRQREELLAEVTSLKQCHDQIHVSSISLKDEGAVLRDALASLERSLKSTHAELLERTAEFENLQQDYQRGREKGRAAVRNFSSHLAHARRQIEQLTAKSVWANRELERVNEEAKDRMASPLPVDIEFAITQRDRTIASLEQQAILMQKRLQVEAASRRKAEGVVKRTTNSIPNSPLAKEARLQLEATDQIERLNRQLTAMRNISLLERQRAAAEIVKFKKRN